MKRFSLLALTAGLLSPIATKSESYAAGLARKQYPTMKKLYDNAIRFNKIADYDAACSKMRSYNNLLKLNFEGLQELAGDSDVDWFDIRKDTLEYEKEICNR